MTTFTPGKYRMANGEMAIVVCDVGENPIGPNDPYPLKGYTENGPVSWSRTGKSGIGFAKECDLLEPWTDTPTALEVCEELDRVVGTGGVPCWLASVVKDARAAIAAEKARTA